MGVSIVVKDASFSKYIGVMGIPRDGLLGEYYFGVDKATSEINHAGGISPVMVGAEVVYGSDYAVLKGASTAYFDTNILETSSMTLLVAVRDVTTNPRLLSTNRSGDSGFGWTGISYGNGDRIYCVATQTASDGTGPWIVDENPSRAAPMVIAVRIDTDDVDNSFELASFQSLGGTIDKVDHGTHPDRALAASDFLMGFTGNGSSFSANSALIYNRPLSDLEVAKAMTYLRTRAGF